MEEFLTDVILLALLGAVVFIPGAAWAGLRNRRECGQAAEMATLLGLQMVDRKQDMARYSGASPLMRLMFPFVPWAMGGVYDGVRVSVGRFGGRLTVHPPGDELREWMQAHPSPFSPIEILKGTRYLAWFDKPLPVEIEIRPAGALYGKLEDRDKLVSSGDDDLDQRCRIFGEKQGEIRAWVGDRDRKAALAVVGAGRGAGAARPRGRSQLACGFKSASRRYFSPRSRFISSYWSFAISPLA